MRKEITLALQHNRRIIPIWHDRFDEGTLGEAVEKYPELAGLANINAIPIDEDAKNPVEGYNNAMTKLVNRFGFTPS